MKQSKVEETKVEKTESGQETAQTEEAKEASKVKAETAATDQSEQKAAGETKEPEEVKKSDGAEASGKAVSDKTEPEKTEKEAEAETEPVKERKRRKSNYDSITLQNMHQEMISQISQINTLTDENESLTVENATLNSKITVLSETVSKKMATEDAISQEESENAMPKGFPLSGTATMEEITDAEEHPMLEFTAADGVNIVSTGTGVVLSIDADEQYGNKIVIDHGNGYQSIYRNSGTPLVKTGETLGKGYILFTVGEDNTKLGYEITQNEEYIDPMTLIEING